MGPIVTILVGVLAPAGLAVGLIAMGASTPNEFMVARIGFTVAAIDLGGLTIWALYKHANSYWHYALGAAIVAFIAITLPKTFRWVDEKELFSGRLIPQNFGIVTGVVLSAKTHVFARRIEIGDSGTIFEIMSGGDTPTFLKFAENYNLSVELIDDEVKVSTQIRDKKQNIIAELIRNEWRVAPPPQAWDRNYNKNALAGC